MDTPEDTNLPPPGEDLVAARMHWINQHLATYLADGRKGHVVDIRATGGFEFSQTLLLKTVGRKSGKPLIVPLLYGIFGDEVIIVGSKGGHPKDPAWLVNMRAQDDVTFQIVEDRYIGPWRELQGAERAKVWAYMAGIYPPFDDYQKSTERLIPVIALTRRKRIDTL
jgi:deazaflavin-dependent oxidoreductase (nitroreductase family)